MRLACGGGKILIQTYLERDIQQFEVRLQPDTLWRLWTMLAYQQGGLVNVAQLARNIDTDVKTVNRYLDILIRLFLLRRLEPWHANLGKRLTKSPSCMCGIVGLSMRCSALAIGRRCSRIQW